MFLTLAVTIGADFLPGQVKRAVSENANSLGFKTRLGSRRVGVRAGDLSGIFRVFYFAWTFPEWPFSRRRLTRYSM